jgi:hypothetical protein
MAMARSSLAVRHRVPGGRVVGPPGHALASPQIRSPRRKVQKFGEIPKTMRDVVGRAPPGRCGSPPACLPSEAGLAWPARRYSAGHSPGGGSVRTVIRLAEMADFPLELCHFRKRMHCRALREVLENNEE